MRDLQGPVDSGDLLQQALTLLRGGDAGGAVERARTVQLEAALTGQPVYNGWALWMLGLGHVYLNAIEDARRFLTQAQTVAFDSEQPSLAMAVSLAQQLIAQYEQQGELRRRVTELLQQLDAGEARLTQQFHAILGLATAAWKALPAPAAPVAPVPPQALVASPAVSEAAPVGRLPRLEVRCLGPFQVFVGGQEVALRSRKQAADLLKYLIAHRERPVSRDALLQLLWPDLLDDRVAHRLHMTVSNLRTLLSPPGGEAGEYILRRDDAYLLNPLAPVTVDMELFVNGHQRGQDLLRAGHAAEAQAAFEAAVALYRGDYLVDNLYDDWTGPTRRHLQQMCLTMLGRLAAGYWQQGRDEDCAAAARRILALDSCSEEAYYYLMLVANRTGQRSLALHQYHTCAETLRKELDAEPSARLTELYRRIAGQEVPDPPPRAEPRRA